MPEATPRPARSNSLQRMLELEKKSMVSLDPAAALLSPRLLRSRSVPGPPVDTSCPLDSSSGCRPNLPATQSAPT